MARRRDQVITAGGAGESRDPLRYGCGPGYLSGVMRLSKFPPLPMRAQPALDGYPFIHMEFGSRLPKGEDSYPRQPNFPPHEPHDRRPPFTSRTRRIRLRLQAENYGPGKSDLVRFHLPRLAFATSLADGRPAVLEFSASCGNVSLGFGAATVVTSRAPQW
jgi:hypothetical protein